MNTQLKILQDGQTTSANVMHGMNEKLSALQSLSSTVTEHDNRIETVEQLTSRLENKIQILTHRLDNLDQISNINSIQINGVPITSNENLQEILNKIGILIGVNCANVIHRIERVNSHVQSRGFTQQNNERTTSIDVRVTPIIATFNNKDEKNIFLTAFRKFKFMYTEHLGFVNQNREVKDRIFIFELLSPILKRTYVQAKLFQKANNYKYLWTKDGKIFLRKSDNSRIIRVFTNTDLSKINSVQSNTTVGNDGDGEGRRGGAESLIMLH